MISIMHIEPQRPGSQLAGRKRLQLPDVSKGRIKALLLVTVLIPFAGVVAQDVVVPVVPLPRVVDRTGNEFSLSAADGLILLSGGSTYPNDQLEQELQEVLVTSLGSDSGLTMRAAEPVAEIDERVGKEGYILEVNGSEVRIVANTDAGIYYGFQTLKQLIRGYAREGRIPGLRIVDWPDLEFRAVSEDISRGPVPTPEYMRDQIDRMAEMKYNALTYYTEHVVKTESHPEFAPTHGSLDIDEWRDLAEYARDRHITLLGNFQSFGHFERILAHPKYAPLGEAGNVLSPTLPESRALLRDIFEEMVPAFDADVFVVNGDETFDLGRGPSKARADSLGIGVVYAEHMLNIREILDSLGVGMVMWGDVLLQHEEALAMMPRDVIIGTWDYTPRDSYDHLITPFTDAGFTTIVCTGVVNSGRIMPDFRVTKDNIRLFTSDGVRHGVYGLLNTVWDDGGSALFGRDWYGVAFAADHSWNSRRDPGDDADFDGRFSLGHFGDPTRALVRAIQYLNELATLEPTDGMTEKVLWAQLVPERNSKLRISLADWNRVVELSDSATSVLEEGDPLVRSHDFEYFRFTADLYRHMATVRENLLDAAADFEKASFLQRSDRSEATELLSSALERVSRSRTSVAQIKEKYRSLWLSENRTYALDWTTDKFEDQEAQLADVEARLRAALSDFNGGAFLPPPSEVRLSISESEGRYFREWLFSGTLPNDDGAFGATTDYLESMGGELSATPGVAVEWDYGGSTYRWRRNETPYHAEVNLAELYPDDLRYVAHYAFATITSPDNRRVRATVGSNDSIKIILNGEVVFENSVKRALIVDDDDVWLDLKEGRNNLMLKISQGTGGWGFSFRLPDEVVRSRKNRYRIVK
jgi:hexosaminidase